MAHRLGADILNNLRRKLTLRLLGILYCSFIVIFMIMSFPVYIFRVVVIFISKFFCTDFGDILAGNCSVYVGDYKTETTPRSNVVMVMIFEGRLTLDKVRGLVIKNWISPKAKLKLEKFQQYPEKLLGFTFWKNIPKPFRVEDYVHEFEGQSNTTDQHLDKFVETLLNKKHPREQSPWELHVVENYTGDNDQPEYPGKRQCHHKSALILKWHHCLMDATGAHIALVEVLFQQKWIRKQATTPPKLSQSQIFLQSVTFPLKAFSKFSYNLSHTFVSNPFKIPDNGKQWHQSCVRSGIIPNKVIKDIKNAFGVSYTSVLLSAISAAVNKTQLQTTSWSVPMFSVLPVMGVVGRKVLANHLTGAAFDLPTICYANPIERLEKVDQLFEKSRHSATPKALQYSSILAGAHFSSVTEFFTKNRMISIGLTNFAGPQGNIEVDKDTKWIHSRTVVGGLSGDCGIAIATFSHGSNTEVYVAVERAVMTKEQADKFIFHIRQEVEALSDLIPEKFYHVEK